MTSPVLTAARDVIDPGHLRAAWRAAPSPTTTAGVLAALRCGAAVALALALAAATGHQDLAGFAALGALASLYGRFDPYRRRAAVVALLGAVLTGAFVAVATLTTAGAPAPVVLGVVALVAAGSTVLCLLVRTGPPGGTIVVFAAAGGMAAAADWSGVAERGLAVAAGSAVAWLVATSGWVVRHGGVLRRMTRRATGRPATGRGATATREPAPAGATPGVLATVRATWHEPGWRLGGVRVTLAALAAGAVAQAAGLGHPAWAQMGATATLQGATTGHAVVRALQRGVGTVVGALLAWPLLAAHLGFAATCVVVVALQVVTEVVVGRHYGLAMLTITPMALLMTSLAAPADPAGTAAARALDTVLGAALGVLAVVLVHARERGAATTG
ncbi:fusaric acid resistance family protein [Isoptericola jiangsuensis]|uniref:Fusaric acid resistance family protein n=1 Tax=Isoptericola jiangsuensis TaxID=548579 RepID=A0A2A9ETV7_9MICO|nr:FUSC family protein [Isoptericola jiangsuensis]PFG42454.1 fusaric acid resistance family protein [Isoptericola jiangsuensis]